MKHRFTGLQYRGSSLKDILENKPMSDLPPRIKYTNGLTEVTSEYVDLKANHPNGVTYLYLLCESNYVGITGNLNSRIGDHKRKGRTNGKVKILGIYDNRIEAHLKETEYHLQGYNGYSGN